MCGKGVDGVAPSGKARSCFCLAAGGCAGYPVDDITHRKTTGTKIAGRGPVPFYPSPEVSVLFIYLRDISKNRSDRHRAADGADGLVS